MNKSSDKVLLVVVAKEPVPGKVKTRFSPDISPAEAAAIYQCMIDDKITEISALSGIDLAIAFTPEHARDAFSSFKRWGFSLFSQKGQDLGERLYNVFVDKLNDGYQAVIIIDSDSPDLPKSTIQEASRLLLSRRVDIVLGPCYDGGYYLVGMRTPHPELFQNIPWSTATVLEDTLKKSTELGLKTQLLSWWNDLDTFEDLLDFYQKYNGDKGPNNSPGQKTHSFLSRMERITNDEMMK